MFQGLTFQGLTFQGLTFQGLAFQGLAFQGLTPLAIECRPVGARSGLNAPPSGVKGKGRQASAHEFQGLTPLAIERGLSQPPNFQNYPPTEGGVKRGCCGKVAGRIGG